MMNMPRVTKSIDTAPAGGIVSSLLDTSGSIWMAMVDLLSSGLAIRWAQDGRRRSDEMVKTRPWTLGGAL